MHYVFVFEHYDNLYKRFQGWKMTSTMIVREYTKECQKMVTRLHPTDNEDQRVHCIITRSSQAIHDEIYPFRITAMHDA